MLIGRDTSLALIVYGLKLVSHGWPIFRGLEFLVCLHQLLSTSHYVSPLRSVLLATTPPLSSNRNTTTILCLPATLWFATWRRYLYNLALNTATDRACRLVIRVVKRTRCTRDQDWQVLFIVRFSVVYQLGRISMHSYPIPTTFSPAIELA
jgi:hypothetical protein